MALHMVLCLVLNSNLQHTTYIIKNRPFGRFFINWIATPSAMARNDKSVVGICSYLVIAREQRDRGDPVVSIDPRVCAGHIYWIAALRSQ